MAISTPIKIGIGLAAIGGASGTAYAIHQQLSTSTENLKDKPITIGQTLKSKGHTLLNFDTNNSGDKTTWDPIVKAYAKSTKKLNNVTITITPTDGTPTQDNVNSLKQACDTVIKSNNNEETLKIAEQYCVTPITITNFLKNKGNVLDTKDSPEANVEEWNDKVRLYPKQATNKPFENVDLSTPSTNDGKDNRKKLRNACKGIQEKQTYDSDFHSNLAKFETWCFVPKKK